MASANGYRTVLGWVGVLCFAIFLGGIFVPDVLDAIPFFSSVFGKLTFMSLPLAAVVLITVTGFRHSKWWLIVSGLITCFFVVVLWRLSHSYCYLPTYTTR